MMNGEEEVAGRVEQAQVEEDVPVAPSDPGAVALLSDEVRALRSYVEHMAAIVEKFSADVYNLKNKTSYQIRFDTGDGGAPVAFVSGDDSNVVFTEGAGDNGETTVDVYYV